MQPTLPASISVLQVGRFDLVVCHAGIVEPAKRIRGNGGQNSYSLTEGDRGNLFTTVVQKYI
jgi:hypothetical protein